MRIFKGIVFLIAGLLILLGSLPFGLYLWGINNLDAPPLPVINIQHKVVMLETWKQAGEIGSPNIRTMNIYDYIFYLECQNRNGINSDICLTEYPGIRIAALAVRNHVYSNLGKSSGKFKSHITRIAYTVWVTRYWTAEQIISTYYTEFGS